MIFSGICQYIASIVEFVFTCVEERAPANIRLCCSLPRLSATTFSAYAGFNVAYALIYLPVTGLLAAYTESETDKPLPELDQGPFFS